MSIFFDRYSELCKEANSSPNAIAKLLSISLGSVTAWKNGTLPRTETIKRIADYFHVSADYLLGNVNDPSLYVDNERTAWEINSQGDGEPFHRPVSDEDIKFALFGGDGEITDEMYEAVKRFAGFIKQQREKEKEAKQD